MKHFNNMETSTRALNTHLVIIIQIMQSLTIFSPKERMQQEGEAEVEEEEKGIEA